MLVIIGWVIIIGVLAFLLYIVGVRGGPPSGNPHEPGATP